MPTDQMLTEQMLPKFRAEESDSERIKAIYNYLFMLVEQLRYSLANISEDNFNTAALDGIKSDIAEPIFMRLESAEGEITDLTVSGGYLASRISSAEGNISILAQTDESLSSRITSAEGDISNLTQTSSSLTSRISNTEGEVSSLSQTVGSFSSRISDAEGSVSSLYQTVNGMTLSVSNGESSSTISLIADGAVISSGNIILSGFVTFADLSTSGSTTINGDNITTGTLNVDLIKPNNGVYVSFSHPVAASSFNSHYFTLGENAEICLGNSSTSSDIVNNYPGAIVLEGTTIIHPNAYAYTYKNGSYGFYEVITAANIEDYLSDVELTAKFG